MKKITTIVKTVLILGLISVGANYAYAAFSSPSATPTGGNMPIPVHTGFDQVKNGDLAVNNFTAI